MKGFRVAIVGATGMVGRIFLKVLEERISRWVFNFASGRSEGKPLNSREKIILWKTGEDSSTGA